MKKHRAFLKWAGGKYGLVEDIAALLPDADRLVEPFVGAGSVFLNTDYDHYLLNDLNKDLVNLYQLLKDDHQSYIDVAAELFCDSSNTKDSYYGFRQEFNDSDDPFTRSVLFLYLNRHGYNGLCRYNLKGGYNVPFGSYKRPYFPRAEMEFFAEKAQRATFTCESFEKSFERANGSDVIYCDPPYAPLSPTASFTSYAGPGFNKPHQESLARCAETAAFEQDIPVLISNHDLPLTRDLYEHAELTVKKVKRTISQKAGKRVRVDELLALYRPGHRLV